MNFLKSAVSAVKGVFTPTTVTFINLNWCKIALVVVSLIAFFK